MIKLTTESCERMYRHVLLKQVERIGRLWPYQSTMYFLWRTDNKGRERFLKLLQKA